MPSSQAEDSGTPRATTPEPGWDQNLQRVGHKHWDPKLPLDPEQLQAPSNPPTPASEGGLLLYMPTPDEPLAMAAESDPPAGGPGQADAACPLGDEPILPTQGRPAPPVHAEDAAGGAAAAGGEASDEEEMPATQGGPPSVCAPRETPQGAAMAAEGATPCCEMEHDLRSDERELRTPSNHVLAGGETVFDGEWTRLSASEDAASLHETPHETLRDRSETLRDRSETLRDRSGESLADRDRDRDRLVALEAGAGASLAETCSDDAEKAEAADAAAAIAPPLPIVA